MYAGKGIKRDKNPREGAGFFSIALFAFTWSVFKIGIRREVQEDDVFEVMKTFGSQKVTDRLEKEWKRELQKQKSAPSIVIALLRSFGRQFALLGLWRLLYIMVYMILRPLSVSKVVKYFTPGSTMPIEEAYMYGFILIALKFVMDFQEHHSSMYLDHVSVRFKASICSLVYRKALKVNEMSTDEVSAGRIMTIISKDVEVFEVAMYFFHDIWIGLFQVAVTSVLLYRAIDDSSFVGIGYLFAMIPIQMVVARATAMARRNVSERTDDRLRIIQEIFATIKLIKIYTWDNYFAARAISARKRETIQLRLLYILRAMIFTIGITSGKVAFYICMMYYLYIGNNLTSETAFYVISCFDGLRWCLAMSIPENIGKIGEAISCFKRIEQYLMASEIPIRRYDHDRDDCSEKPTMRQIHLKNVEVCVQKKSILKNISLRTTEGMIGITGPVGSGKSMLLKTILEDVLITSGTITVRGTLSYASQEPWIFPGTIRQNILFGQEYDPSRYKLIIQLCALDRDIQSWPQGDSFLVIDRGLNISRGQQARINLARAIYRPADIYLLDDSLSALDSVVSAHVFNNCIKNFLARKLVVLVTHNNNFLNQCSAIVYMRNGRVSHRGTYQQLEEAGVDFGDSLHNATAEIIDSKERSNDNDEKKEVNGVMDTETTKLLESNIESTQIYKEFHKEGKVDFAIYKLYFMSCGGFKLVVPLLMLYCCSNSVQTYYDYFTSKWTDLEQNRTDYITGDLTNTTDYLQMVPVYDFNRWMFTIILAFITLFNVSMAFMFYTLTSMASRNIHRQSFQKIMGATMEFFDMNLPGNVLNRFSKDCNVVDEQIPNHMWDCIEIFFAMLGIAFNISLTNPVFVVLTIALACVLYVTRCYYIQTGRSLHRLNGITRAPMIGHLNASLNGLTTIRATGTQQILSSQFDRHQDLNISVFYTHLSTARAFRLYMDIVSGFYITTIILTFLMFDKNAMAGSVGLAITQSFSMTGVLQWGIRQWSQVENRMTSVERIMEYAELKQEDKKGAILKNWPSDGKLEYQNVSMCYTNSDQPVLKNMTFSVKPREKIGIIGRTGAGKSSILSAMFRLYPTSGSITIDDVNLNDVELELARSKISIIPQDPVLFSGTLRTNLDPHGLHSDDDLWRALKEVDLTPLADNLDKPIPTGGGNFSIGQRQLICLARAILRNNRILVLDEATASVDPHTDALMQQTIARVFAQCTMLVIAHRLHTVLGCDKVLVVDGGRVAEFGTPDELLRKRDGIFRALVHSSGMLSVEHNFNSTS